MSTQHMVEPNPGGWFDVLSSHSGNHYRVIPVAQGSAAAGGAACTCEWFFRSGGLRGACSHVKAVVAYAAKLDAPPARLLRCSVITETGYTCYAELPCKDHRAQEGH